MRSDEVVLVIGADSDADPTQSPTPPSRRPMMAGVVVLAALITIAVWASQGDGEAGSAIPTLAAPPEPATTTIAERGAPTTRPPPPELATGWHMALTPGSGSVMAVAHGPLGWLAVTGGGADSLVMTSTDAVLWDARTLTSGVATTADQRRDHITMYAEVTGDRYVVAGEVWSDGATRGHTWVSGDGVTWSEIPLPEGFRPEGVSEAYGVPYTFGAFVGDTLYDQIRGRAAVLRLDGDEWVPVELPIADPDGSVVVEVVPRFSEVAAIGIDEGGMAVWIGDGRSSFRRQEVEIEDRFSRRVPFSVTRMADGSWAVLVGDPTNFVASSVLVSNDLVEWSWVTSTMRGVSELVATGDTFLAFQNQDPAVLMALDPGGDWEILMSRFVDVVGGIEDAMWLSAAAASGDTIVVGGAASDSGPGLWTRGPTQPAVLLPAPDPAAGFWEVVVDADGAAAEGGAWLGDPTRRGDTVFLPTASGLYGFEGGELTRELIGPVTVFEVGDDVYAVRDGLDQDTSTVYRRTGDGLWDQREVETTYVVAMSRLADGRAVAIVGPDPGNWQMMVQADSGAWEASGPVGGEPDMGWPVGMPLGGFLTGGGPDGVMWSADGLVWETTDLPANVYPQAGGTLIEWDEAAGGVTRIGWVEKAWPEVNWIDSPTGELWGMARSGPSLALRGDDGVWVSADGGSTWGVLPVTLESGVAASSWISIAADVPTIATIDGDHLTIRRWVPPVR
jgi:hypothetical protein